MEEKGRTRKYAPLSIPVSYAIEKGPRHSLEIHSGVLITPSIFIPLVYLD